MKCEHCGKNEVTFVYQSNINGQVEEKHLCAQCAEKLGYTQRVAAQSRRMMQSLFDGSFMQDFFSPQPFLLGRMNRLLDDPFDDFFAEMPALGAPRPETEEPQKKENLVDEKEQSRFSKLRQLNALKHELKQAVRQEEFERCAQLRDQIHALEAEDQH